MSDYPCAPIEGVDPVFVPYMLRGAMALRYARCTDMDYDDAVECAVATWDTDWETDPSPRTLANAVEAVDSDLEHWDGE